MKDAIVIFVSVFCGYLFGAVTHALTAKQPTQAFTDAQCIVQPSGREHKTYAEVTLPTGEKRVADGPAFHEWITACERSEWK